MNEIEKILQKLETAANLQKPGALTEAEFATLKKHISRAEDLRTEARRCAHVLEFAVKCLQ
jgi:HD-GYP domain-containing protein (c-di-GMP phosphodiesterase class II)